MPSRQIRAKALGVFLHHGSLLVFEGYDPVKNETFYRPLGGGIEFGETGAQALVREIGEEIGAQVTNVRYLGLSENIFTYAGEAGHEIVLLYEAELVDNTLYGRNDLQAVEPGGVTFRVLWKPLADFADGGTPLYPNGLFSLLTGGGDPTKRVRSAAEDRDPTASVMKDSHAA
jgi:ADP-ribose pyrophosphatase YjhB (NUDIX family)